MCCVYSVHVIVSKCLSCLCTCAFCVADGLKVFTIISERALVSDGSGVGGGGHSYTLSSLQEREKKP